MLSVVVPVYNEERALPRFLERAALWEGCFELLFSDGGSTDATLELLAGHKVVSGAKGRGGQCNRGARAACGDALLFLHADELVDPAVPHLVAEAVGRGARWGCLTLRWDLDTPAYRFGAWVSNLRAARGTPFGDQGVFLTRELFEEVGGFPDLPIMEDYELSRRLAARGLRPVQLKAEVVASARRFEEGGPVRTALGMYRLRRLYRAGAPIEEIEAAYRDVRGGACRDQKARWRI